LGGEGLSACSGDILLESLVACAGVTLGEIAKAMEADSGVMLPVKYWELIADKLHAAGWSWGYCRVVTHHSWRWIVDADREGGRRHIVQSDELLTAFLQLEAMFSAETIPDRRAQTSER
jgi:hypothetical protein